MLRCAPYLRVSTEFDSQKTSLDTQKLLLEDYAKENGWTIIKTYADSHTATKGERENFEQMLDDALEGKFDIILCKDVTRINKKLWKFF